MKHCSYKVSGFPVNVAEASPLGCEDMSLGEELPKIQRIFGLPTLKMKAITSCETLGNVCLSTQSQAIQQVVLRNTTDEGIKIFRNVGCYLPNKVAPFHRRTENPVIMLPSVTKFQSS